MSFSASVKVAIRMLSRSCCGFNSTKLTYAQNPYLPEFSLENYDCVGFDLDHTICSYKLKPLFSLIYKTLASFLCEKYDYSKDLLCVSDSDMSFAHKGIILDKARGNFLKLDYQYKIFKASHGMKLLNDDDIERIYGVNKVWDESKNIPQKLVSSSALEEPFYVFKDYFVTPGAVVYAKMIDSIDKRMGIPSNYYSSWNHYLEGLFYMYERYNFKNDSGEFFPDLKHNPDKYLKCCDEKVKQWLKTVKSKKVTFLLTSSNYDSAAFLAEYALGRDWKEYFDIIVTFARKPGFFWKNKPFYIVHGDNEISDVNPSDMKPNLIYSQGNWKQLREVCAMFSKSSDPKVLYFGDSLIEDVYAASEIAQCDTVAIVEEMLAEGMENIQQEHEETDLLVSDYWGSFFGSKCTDNESELSLWAYLLSQHSKLTVPDLNSIIDLGVNDKVQSFTPDSAHSGFYPGIPKILSSS